MQNGLLPRLLLVSVFLFYNSLPIVCTCPEDSSAKQADHHSDQHSCCCSAKDHTFFLKGFSLGLSHEKAIAFLPSLPILSARHPILTHFFQPRLTHSPPQTIPLYLAKQSFLI